MVTQLVTQDSSVKAGRLAFIDWTRGLAALIMLQGHTFHSFTRNDLRGQGPYVLSQFFGGEAPALFLFLTGITYAFLMSSQEKKGASSTIRVQSALRRAGYLFLLAFLFRISLFVLGFPGSPVSELLRVDILNCMGMAMLLFAPMAVFSTLDRVRLCSVLGVLIAALSPLVPELPLSWVPGLLRNYFVPNLNYFAFFPWASFLAFGMAAGSLIRLVERERLSQAMQWMALTGIALIVGGHYFSNFPYSFYAKPDYWLDSPGLIAVKLGVVFVLLAFSWVWANGAIAHRWSIFRQLGTTSLLVYWVHIELVYGRWFGAWKESLTFPQVALFSFLLIALMTLLSVLRTRGNFPPNLFRSSAPLPAARSTGD